MTEQQPDDTDDVRGHAQPAFLDDAADTTDAFDRHSRRRVTDDDGDDVVGHAGSAPTDPKRS